LIASNASQSTGIFDLHHVTALNSSRESPFENGMATAPNNFAMSFSTQNSNHPTINALISQTHPPANSAYYASLPQQINSVFQSQLHDRL